MKAILLALSLISSSAFADQCAWNSRAIADRGAKLIKQLAGINGEKPSAYTLCEPCGETKMERVVLNEDNSNASGFDVGFAQAEMGGEKFKTYWEVSLNRASASPVKVDLAYVYVKTAKDVYANVATLVNCPVQGVTPVIYLGQ
jgi:hypothetical protein